MPRGEAPRYIEPAPPYPKKTKCAMRPRPSGGGFYKICYKSDTGNPEKGTKSRSDGSEARPKAQPKSPPKAPPKEEKKETKSQEKKSTNGNGNGKKKSAATKIQSLARQVKAKKRARIKRGSQGLSAPPPPKEEKKEPPKKKEEKKEPPKKKSEPESEFNEFYDFRGVEWKDPKNTKRHKLFMAIKEKQGNDSKISMKEIVKIAKNILNQNEQVYSKVRAYVDETNNNRGFVQRNNVKRVNGKQEPPKKAEEKKEPPKKAEEKKPEEKKEEKKGFIYEKTFDSLEEAKKFSKEVKGKITTLINTRKGGEVRINGPDLEKSADAKGYFEKYGSKYIDKFLNLMKKLTKEKRGRDYRYKKGSQELISDMNEVQKEMFPTKVSKRTGKLAEVLGEERVDIMDSLTGEALPKPYTLKFQTYRIIQDIYNNNAIYSVSYSK